MKRLVLLALVLGLLLLASAPALAHDRPVLPPPTALAMPAAHS